MSSTDLDLHCPLGLLLDSDFPPFGSSTSLCSDNSLASRTDAAPLLFMVDSPEKDGTMTSAATSSATSAATSAAGTHPVTVPDMTSSPSVSSERSSASPVVGRYYCYY